MYDDVYLCMIISEMVKQADIPRTTPRIPRTSNLEKN